MSERFFAAGIGPDDLVRLEGDEAHHLAHVRRLRRGDPVRIFDGSGLECEASVEDVGKRHVTLSISRRLTVDRELPFALTLACSPPKGERLRWLVEKATELGVTRFVPILTERATEQVRGSRPEKMVRWVIEASKQCGRNVLMELAEPVPCIEYLKAVDPLDLSLLAQPGVEPLPAAMCRGPSQAVNVAVGPEGGFNEQEVQSARSRGWKLVSLGPRTLRVETAALALAAWFALSEGR